MTRIPRESTACGPVVDGVWELVAIPVVVSFDELVPASQIEQVWCELAGFGNGAGPRDEFLLFPHMFSFDQLMLMPIAMLKEVVLQPVAGQEVLAKINQYGVNFGFKRSTTFLRYLVGFARIRSITPEGIAAFCARLERNVMSSISRYIGQVCGVSLSLGVFRDSLYVGMWRYQMSRLVKLSQCAISEQCHGLHAGVAIRPDEQRGLRVGFFSEKSLIGGRDYLLFARPTENPLRCIERVRKKIEESGIRTVVLDHDVRFDLPLAMPI